MEVHILTIFPEMFTSPLQASILQRAQERCLLQIQVHNLRDFTTDRHHVTDDYPYGGVDARVQAYVQAEMSIGDYVLTGGELPAMVLLDVVGRQLPGVLGDSQS